MRSVQLRSDNCGADFDSYPQKLSYEENIIFSKNGKVFSLNSDTILCSATGYS